MATCANPINPPTPKTEKHSKLTCELCRRSYRMPRVITCLHVFCTECIERHVIVDYARRMEGIQCPICRDVSLAPIGCTRGYPLDTEVMKKITQHRNTDKMECTQCKMATAAVAVCDTCDRILCQGCFDKHVDSFNMRRYFPGHKVLYISMVTNQNRLCAY